jgi:hypothetical protein
MRFKATAPNDVKFLARVPKKHAEDLGHTVGMRPYEAQERISLRRGESRGGLGLIIGIDPRCLPNEKTQVINGVVPLTGSPDMLPKVFFGLLRVEAESDNEPSQPTP